MLDEPRRIMPDAPFPSGSRAIMTISSAILIAAIVSLVMTMLCAGMGGIAGDRTYLSCRRGLLVRSLISVLVLQPAFAVWLCYAFVLFAAALVPLVAGPDEPSVHHANVSMTMTFVVMGIGTNLNAIVNRRDPASGFGPPLLGAVGVGVASVDLLLLATQLPALQSGLLTTSLTGRQWLACLALAFALPVVVEVGKLVRKRRTPQPQTIAVHEAVDPARATAPVRS